MAVRPIDGNEFMKKLTLDTSKGFYGEFMDGSDTAYTSREIGRFIEDMPTLTPPNEPMPVLVNDEPDREYIDYICPRCKDIISQRRRGQRMETVYQCKYHDNCGQRMDWSNPQPYRRPLEGGDADHG